MKYELRYFSRVRRKIAIKKKHSQTSPRVKVERRMKDAKIFGTDVK